jgi:hypothetical protein
VGESLTSFLPLPFYSCLLWVLYIPSLSFLQCIQAIMLSPPSAPLQEVSSPYKPELTAFVDEDDYLQNVPSNFDLALNGGTNHTYLSPKPTKSTNNSLLPPDSYRRLSISTISSNPSRNPSPYPPPPPSKTFKGRVVAFWNRNYGLFLVALSQLFGALMNVTTRLLELEGDGMDPLQVLFARMGLTMVFCVAWMWWKEVPDFLLGQKGIRWLLIARGFVGFFGIYGMYCKLFWLQYIYELLKRLKKVALTINRLPPVSTRSRRSGNHFLGPVGSFIRLLPFPPRTISSCRPIRFPHFSTRRRSHCTSNLLLHFSPSTRCSRRYQYNHVLNLKR